MDIFIIVTGVKLRHLSIADTVNGTCQHKNVFHKNKEILSYMRVRFSALSVLNSFCLMARDTKIHHHFGDIMIYHPTIRSLNSKLNLWHNCFINNTKSKRLKKGLIKYHILYTHTLNQQNNTLSQLTTGSSWLNMLSRDLSLF